MRCTSTVLLIQITFLQGFAQKAKTDHQIGLSIPVIWNNTEIYNVFSGARATHISGSAVSYGINATYTCSISECFYATAGIGYFNQRFGVGRPFNFNGDTITKLLYNTRSYNYNNISLSGGVGYSLMLKDKYSIAAGVELTALQTLKQKYTPDYLSIYAHKTERVEKRSYFFGTIVCLSAGVSRKLGNNLRAGVEFLLPISERWRKDRIFTEDESGFYGSQSGFGSRITVKYSL